MISREESTKRLREIEARYETQMLARVAADNRFPRREPEAETVTPLWNLVEK